MGQELSGYMALPIYLVAIFCVLVVVEVASVARNLSKSSEGHEIASRWDKFTYGSHYME
jgi:hypothetical protein